MNRLQRGDMVVIISGAGKGQKGRVKKVLVDEDKVIVEGVNLIKRHTRPSPRNQQGGIIEREAALPSCKVMPLDPQTNKPTRIKIKTDASGHKMRVAKSGAEIRAER